MFLLAACTLVVVVLAFSHAWLDLLTSPRLARTPIDPARVAGRLSVLVPARDEELNIGRCLASLVAQDHPDLEIVVIDDGSQDATADIVREVARRDARIQLLECPPKPPGWQGKSWALTAGGSATRGSWIAMIDADVTLSRSALTRAVALAREQDVVLLSLLPALRDESFWEKVIQPVIGFFIFLCQPLWRARAPGSGVVVANGQFLLVEREAYDRVGGHGSVRSAIVEDVELARVFKHNGLPLLLAPAFDDLSVRMYRGLSGIWRGWGKTIHPYLAQRPLALWLAIAPLTVIFLGPFILLPVSIAIASDATTTLLQALTVAVILANALAFRRASRHELFHGLLWPVAFVVLLALFAERTVATLAGAGVTWKGRTYS